MGKLKGTCASGLALGHIESLELVELCAGSGIEVIYDVGANVGTWVLLAKALIPQAEIHAFEPLELHHARFAELTKHLERVRMHPVALGAESRELQIHRTDFSDASSPLPLTQSGSNQFGIRNVEAMTVPMHRLDDYRSEHNLPWPDLIKLDVQGYELEVLKGGSACLERAKAVICEVSFGEFYQGQCSFHEVVAHFSQYGLHIHALSAGTLIGAPAVQSDILFIRS